MTLVQFLSEWIVRSSVLILSGAALVWLLRVKHSSIRLMAWIAILTGSLAIPFLSAVLPKVPIEVRLASARSRGSLLSVAPPATKYLLRIPRPDSNTDLAPLPPTSARPFDWMRLAATLYALAVCLLLLRLVLGFALSIRVFRRSSPTGLEVEGTQVRESDHVASPVTIGVFRPAMLLPLDWREWNSAKLNAVLTHERSHIRRHDPAVQFLSAIHRALLWANPLSWILHRSIVRTAEEVSDGDAIAATGDRVSYAETLLGLMQRGVGQASWLGVPMALYDRPERRIRRILNSAVVTRSLTRRSVAAIVALAAPLAWLAASAQTQSVLQPPSVPAPIVSAPSPLELPSPIALPLAQAVAPQSPSAPKPASESRPTRAPLPPAQQPIILAQVQPQRAPMPTRLEFEAASVKPNKTPFDLRSLAGRTGPPPDAINTNSGRYTEPRSYLLSFIARAYGISGREIAGGPSWLWSPSNDDYYSIDATAGHPATRSEIMRMLQSLLADRFRLTVHHETREVPVYALVVAKNGPKFKAVEASPDDTPRMAVMGGRIESRKGTMSQLADQLTAMLIPWPPTGSNIGSRVIDKTGLTGNYDFLANWIPETQSGGGGGGARGGGADTAAPTPTGGTTVFRVLEDQLGLRLEQQKAPVEILVIDHVERSPTEN